MHLNKTECMPSVVADGTVRPFVVGRSIETEFPGLRHAFVACEIRLNSKWGFICLCEALIRACVVGVLSLAASGACGAFGAANTRLT